MIKLLMNWLKSTKKLAFEGGEAETLAVDGPIFKKRINILKNKKTWHLDSGLYIIEEAELEDK